MSDCSCPLSALTRTLDHKIKGIRSLRILGHQLALILIRRFLLWLESGKDPSYQLRSWKGTEASGSRLPSTCPPVFFTSSSAIFTPTKDYLSRTPKEVTYIDEKKAERTTKKLMYCAELRNPSPQKQTAGHSAPTAGSMRAKICSIDISIRSSITRSLRSWNLSEKIFCLLYFPFWMSKRCALQAKFVTSGMKYRIPTSCGNHMCGSSATDGRFQLILVELKTGNRALLSSLQDVCIQDRLRKQKKNWVSILWRLC